MKRAQGLVAGLLAAGVAMGTGAVALTASPAAADPTAVVAYCQGTGGYDANGIWTFTPATYSGSGTPFVRVCGDATPDPTNPNVPPPVASGDTDPLDNAFWAPGAVLSQTFPYNNDDALAATGAFACGSGTLNGITNQTINGTQYRSVANDTDYSLAWTATFANGVGQVSGTATASDGSTKNVSGTIVIADGSPVPGPCSDTVGSETVVVALLLS